MNDIISVFAINLKSRIDRRMHILDQFNEREEFHFQLVEAHTHTIGAKGLWMTIKHILKDLAQPQDDYIIICQDDHLFTEHYSKEQLFCYIDESRSLKADILSCGISGFTSSVPVSEHIFWVEKFSGLQFTIIFKKFFEKILSTGTKTIHAADLKLCELTKNKFFCYPFLSVQKDFGYSDVTIGNNIPGHMSKVFYDSNEKVTILNFISNFYTEKIRDIETQNIRVNVQSVVIPTFIVPSQNGNECLSALHNQFAGKKEFDVKYIDSHLHKIGELGIWLWIKKTIKTAMENDDDVIIICREDYQFTKHYNPGYFLPAVWKAGLLDCNVLLGGLESFNLALPVTRDLFWIDSFRSSGFFVIYKVFYEKILEEPFSDTDTIERKFSEMTSSKLILHPFISAKKDIENRSYENQEVTKLIAANSCKVQERLLEIGNAYSRFKESTN